MLIDVKEPDHATLMQSSNKALQIATEFEIKNNEDCEKATRLLKRIKERISSLNEQRLEITRPMDEAKSKIMLLFKQPITLLNDAEIKIKFSILEYTKKQQEIVRIEREKAELKAKQEREALEIEAKIIKQKAIAEIEALKTKANALADSTEKAKIQTEISSAIVSAKDQINEITSIAESIKPEHVPVSKKQEGVHLRQIWKGKCVDISKLLNHIIVSGENIELLMINEQLLNKMARETKGNAKIPGIEFYSEQTIAAKI